MENPNANQKENFNKLLEEYNNQLPENKKEYFVITEKKFTELCLRCLLQRAASV
jgi:hypothetical protein